MSSPPFRAPNRGLAISTAPSRRKSGRKKRFSFYPRNPLKSLDSDERIQGNPTLIIGGFAAKRRRSKKTKIGSIRLNGQPATEKEPNRFHPKAKRSRRLTRSSACS